MALLTRSIQKFPQVLIRNFLYSHFCGAFLYDDDGFQFPLAQYLQVLQLHFQITTFSFFLLLFYLSFLILILLFRILLFVFRLYFLTLKPQLLRNHFKNQNLDVTYQLLVQILQNRVQHLSQNPHLFQLTYSFSFFPQLFYPSFLILTFLFQILILILGFSLTAILPLPLRNHFQFSFQCLNLEVAYRLLSRLQYLLSLHLLYHLLNYFKYLL